MNLKEYLKKNKISAATFARDNQLSIATVYRVYQGRANLTAAVAERIAEATGGKVTKEKVMWP